MTASFNEFQKARRDGETAVREAVFGWVMSDAPGEMTLAHARSLATAITRQWNLEAGRMYEAITEPGAASQPQGGE
jgi:hypothetical protein